MHTTISPRRFHWVHTRGQVNESWLRFSRGRRILLSVIVTVSSSSEMLPASETSSALDTAGCIEFLILEQSMKGVWIGTRGPIANA